MAVGAGLLVGGASTAAAAFVVGSVLTVVPWAIRVTLAVVAMGLLAFLLVAREWDRLPQRRQLIPAERLSLGPLLGGFFFGAELGVGWRTVVPSVLPYAVLVALLTVPTWSQLAGLTLGWAIGRFVPIAWAVRKREQGDGGFPVVPAQRVVSSVGLLAIGVGLLWQA